MTDEELDSAAGGLAGASTKTPDTGSKLGAAPGTPDKKVASSGGDSGICPANTA